MEKTVIIHKKIGETPLEAVNRFKSKHSKYRNQKISYAGRLDPTANGQLLLLIGEENKKRSQYEKLDKEYVFEVLFGVSTESNDILGLINQTGRVKTVDKKALTQALAEIKKRRRQRPPFFASVPLKGKPLYYWARRGQLSQDQVPERKVTVYSIRLEKLFCLERPVLKKSITRKIKAVKGDFRQKKITTAWENFFNNTGQTDFPVAKIKIRCASGTYVRAIARDLGNHLGIPALALSIRRTKILTAKPILNKL